MFESLCRAQAQLESAGWILDAPGTWQVQDEPLGQSQPQPQQTQPSQAAAVGAVSRDHCSG